MLKKVFLNNFHQLFILLLFLIALHSFAVGLALIVMPSSWIKFFGFYGYQNNFFRTMGGVFHLVMVIAYIMAFLGVKQNKLQFHGFIPFIIMAKSLAFLYLTLYYFCLNPIITILLSGLADGFMSLLVYLFYRRFKRNQK